MIEADIDAYGKMNRSSSLADFVEFSALKEGSFRHALMEDVLFDKWSLKRHIISQRPPAGREGHDNDSNDDGDSAEDFILRMKACLLERSSVLGSAYPFEIEDSKLTLKDGFNCKDSPYIELLFTTLVHAFKLAPKLLIHNHFETLASDAISSLGFVSVNLGELSRNNGGNIRRTLEALAQNVGIDFMIDNVAHRASANEEGADFFGLVNTGDTRKAQLTLIGQFTCGSSDDWLKKSGEPSPSFWSRIMDDPVHPIPFYAVPHHAESAAFDYLTDKSARVILDRLRLAKMLLEGFVPHPSLYGTVMAADFESLNTI